MTEKERLLASVLALTVVFVILFSGFFVIAEANHDCIEEDCPICCQISVCENTLRSAGTVRTTAVFAAFLILFTFVLPSVAEELSNGVTLVTLKIKLSN